MSNLEKECSTNGMRCDVVTLYSGAMYNLYKYKKYDDVRLVFAPEFDIAFFGGDPDNFEYPRYDLDISFFRAYENGQPAKIDELPEVVAERREGGRPGLCLRPSRPHRPPADHGPARLPARLPVSAAAQVAGAPHRHAAEVQRAVGGERARSRERHLRPAELLQGGHRLPGWADGQRPDGQEGRRREGSAGLRQLRSQAQAGVRRSLG